MPKMAQILQRIVAVLLLFALSVSPIVDAVKHGPAAYVAEMEHNADHARHPATHQHHNINDHDHTAVVILPATLAQPVQFAGNFDLPAPAHVSDMRPQLPRRPPRA